MQTSLRVLGVVLNIFMAGLGFLFAPKGKKTRGIAWFGGWLLGNLVIPVLFSMEGNGFSILWNVFMNIASAIDFFGITKVHPTGFSRRR